MHFLLQGAVFILLVVTDSVSGAINYQGTQLSIGATTIPNHEWLLKSTYQTSVELLCSTTYTSCCDSPANNIGWFYPNGAKISNQNNGEFYATSGQGVLRLHNINNGGAQGLFRCTIPNADGMLVNLYVGFYNTQDRMSGIPTNLEPIQFSLVSSKPIEFRLTVQTSGGPVTTTIWRKDNQLPLMSTDVDFTMCSYVNNTVQALYTHTLTVRGFKPGDYSFSPTNDNVGFFISTDPSVLSQSSTNIVGVDPPTTFGAEKSGSRTISVTWTPPASVTNLSGYKIFYMKLNSEDSSENSVMVSDSVLTHELTLTDGFVYSITMISLSDNLPSGSLNPVSVVLPSVDECAIQEDNCDENADCMDTTGSFTCTCRPGYSGDGTSCTDINECDEGTHMCTQNCMNTIGTYSCSCNDGFYLDGDGLTCNDVEECSNGENNCYTSSQADAAECMETPPGSFTCTCRSGFTGDGITSCVDIDECATGDHQCEQLCFDRFGSYDCGCGDGFTFGPDRRSCIDVDECQRGIALCNQECFNNRGSYICGCLTGYRLSSENNYMCIDIDECVNGEAQCEQNCKNTNGSYVCSCNEGYSGERTCRENLPQWAIYIFIGVGALLFFVILGCICICICCCCCNN